MSLTTCFKLHDLFPNLFVINTAENADKIIMRIYFKQNHFKKNVEVNLSMIESICNGSLTPSLMVGQMPTICSSFNKIVLNESFIQQNINDINSQLNDINSQLNDL